MCILFTKHWPIVEAKIFKLLNTCIFYRTKQLSFHLSAPLSLQDFKTPPYFLSAIHNTERKNPHSDV